MDPLQALISGASSAVVATILRIGFEVVESTSSASILKKNFGDLLKRRAVAREIDKITDRSAKSFCQLIEKEFPEIGEDDIALVSNAVATVINTTELTPKLLTATNLNPEDLCRVFLSRSGRDGGNPGLANHPDPNVRNLYRQLLLGASQQIVDISSQFPGLSENVFREVLQRENNIYNIASKILDGIDQLLSAQSGVDTEAERYETQFRLACIRKHDFLQLFGIDLDRSNRRYRLSTAYVALDVEFVEDENPSSPDTGSTPSTLEPMRADEALARTTRLLVRGFAGAGKSTLVQWVSVFCARRGHSGPLSHLNDLVPFVIRMRDFEDQALPKPDKFAHAVASNVGGEPDRWSHRILESGRAFVLIDGLDEVSEERRVEVKGWLEDLLAQYPNAHYLVTTRPHAIAEGWLESGGFVDSSLRPMSRPDIDRFIEHWHDAVASGVDDEEKDAVSALCQALQTELRASPEISKLATSPLLCAIICALHRDRNAALPKNKVGLYKSCIEMFLRRDVERKINVKNYIDLNDNQIVLLLRALAWWMIRNGKTSASVADVHSRIDHAKQELNPPLTDFEASEISRLLVHRVALLREYTTDKINFPHRTFQEFLAAQEAIAEGDLPLVIENAEKEQWREVAILAAGLIQNKKEAEAFVESLLTRGDEQEEDSMYLIGFEAWQNLSSSTEGSNLQAKATLRLQKIVPPSSITSAKSLANVGEMVIPYLSFSSKMSGVQEASSVRALRLIGLPRSTETLLTYKQSRRVRTWREMISEMRSNADFHELVFKKFGGLESNFVLCGYESGADLNINFYLGEKELITFFRKLWSTTFVYEFIEAFAPQKIYPMYGSIVPSILNNVAEALGYTENESGWSINDELAIAMRRKLVN